MSTFDDGGYRWRETYFVFFRSAARPTLEQFEKTFGRLRKQFELAELKANEEGLFDSARIIAAEANAAIDVSFVDGEEVTEQLKALRSEIRPVAEDDDERKKLKLLRECDARLDVLHFERVTDFGFADDEDEPDEMLDPGALLIVMERLVKLCDGVGVDPASSAVI
ncbi:MAG: hypothetical protein K8T25_10820 [Planctomycetia bacterium]|nr:hypothetical protein [Planctomycetia bacterium]